MIDGLKVTIDGPELAELCEARAGHHTLRAATYGEQVAGLRKAEVEPMQYSGGDPIKALADKQAQHEAEAAELAFIAAHIDPAERYLLSRQDLQKLGITKSAF